MVDVAVITFNHEKYISSTLDSILNQKTTFPFKIIVSEDYGSDSTRSIVQDYVKKHSQIELLDFKKNIGITPNFFSTIASCSSKYIALCEGDDYWTDSNKLQEQVDFLESNSDVIAVGDNAEILYDDGHTSSFSPKPNHFINTVDFFRSRQVPTAGVMFRNIDIPVSFKTLIFGDTPLFVHLSLKGKFYFREKMTSVYRLGEQGVTADIGLNKAKSEGVIKMNLYLDQYTNLEYSNIISFQIAKHLWILAKNEKRLVDKLYYVFKSVRSNPRYLLNRIFDR